MLASSLLAAGLFAGMVLLLEVGRRVGARRLAGAPEGARAGTGTVEGAIFALLGLLLAFTFSGAATRFDTRRHLIVEETNAVGTAYLRLDLLPAGTQPALRQLFRQYLEARLGAYRMLPDEAAARAELARAEELAKQLWARAVEATQADGAPPAAAMLLLPALNQMIDIATSRTLAVEMHPPAIVFVMLFGLALASALLAGYGMAGGRRRSWVHIVGFAAIMATSVYVILDIEYPRRGFIRVESFDRALEELLATMR